MSIKIRSRLPEGAANGLDVLAPALVRDPRAMHVVIAVLDCQSIASNFDSGSIVPTARIRRIEVVTGTGDLERAEQLIRRAIEKRVGAQTLPLDIEDELTEIFKQLDAHDEDLFRSAEEPDDQS